MNTTYLRVAQAFERQYEVHSNDNKAQFKAVWDTVKVIPKEERVKEVKLMKKASETIQLNSARREYRHLLAMAESYALLPDRHINLTAVTFENLTRALTLVKRVTTHYEGDVSRLAGLSEVYESGMSPHRYNNLYEARCKQLSEALPAKIEVKARTTEDALHYADTLDVTVKTALLERLLNDLGYSLQEVA